MRRRDHEAIVKDMRDRIRFLERQNDELLNRLMYVSGSTWTPPPAPVDAEPANIFEPYAFAPEQVHDAAAVLE